MGLCEAWSVYINIGGALGCSVMMGQQDFKNLDMFS